MLSLINIPKPIPTNNTKIGRTIFLNTRYCNLNKSNSEIIFHIQNYVNFAKNYI